MTRAGAFIPNRLRPWIEARRRWRLSHLHVQMARELGLNPDKLGKLANHDQEPWKAPLPDFIAHLYARSFGRPPEVVRTIEEIAAAEVAKKAAKKAAKLAERAEADPSSGNGESGP
jgi:hypothetical protein